MSLPDFVNADRRKAPTGKLTYQEFFDWCDDKTFAEWVDGEVRPLPEVTYDHVDIVGYLRCLLMAYTEQFGLGTILGAPFQVRLHRSDSVRVPDLTFILTENENRITDYCVDGPPDLVIEVVGPDTVERDHVEKRAAYEIEGVKEYWIIDPPDQKAEFFVANEGVGFVRVDAPSNGVYRSSVLRGFSMPIDRLFDHESRNAYEVIRIWQNRSVVDLGNNT